MVRFLSFRRITSLTALLLLSMPLVAACGPSSESGAGGGSGAAGGSGGSGGSGAGGSSPDGGTATVPTVLSNTPLGDATGVPTNGFAGATFSEDMDGATLTPKTFTLTSDMSTVPGTVTYAKRTAVFWPATHLASNTTFTATITAGAKSASGVAIASAHKWIFTTGDVAGPGVPVDLGTAGGYVILAKTGISTAPSSIVTGALGISPAAASYITGFSLTADATNVFSTSAQVTGKVYAADYKPPTPSNLTTAVGDMELAFTAAAARAPDFTELGAGDIGGMTLVAGVYKWGTGLLIPTSITLAGSGTDVWIFQIAKDLTVSNAAQITLTGGALSRNVFWQVAGLVSVGTTAHIEGVVLTQTSITLKTGASLGGRLLAQTAVSLSGSNVVEPK